jgi:hypothetical protein
MYCNRCGIETDEYVSTINDENLCYGCDAKRLIEEQ